MVEHAAVNRRVVGSSPTRGAKTQPRTLVWGCVALSVDCPANGRRLDSLSWIRGANDPETLISSLGVYVFIGV